MEHPTGSSTSARLNIVAVYAHPDDGEFHAAGSLAKWAAAGHRVHAICATDGALGSKRRDVTASAVAAARARELTNALATIGGEPPIFLGFPDGFLIDHQKALRERLIHHLRRLRADRVITFDPHKRYEIHPDHLTIGRMASEAAVFSCFPLLHPEHLDQGLEAVQPKEVWYMGPLEHRPNRIIDISATLKTKIRATLCHESQLEMLADWFVKGADPRALTPAQTAQLESGAETFLEGMGRGMALASGGKIEIAECFYALPVGPGHFDIYQQMAMEQMGAPPEEPQLG
jgi:LmbE family N-acetylglucosaminyl deacetylase